MPEVKNVYSAEKIKSRKQPSGQKKNPNEEIDSNRLSVAHKYSDFFDNF